MSNSYIRLTIQGVVLFILQVILFRNIALFDVAFCFVYIGVLLFLPVEIDRILTLIIAFMVGLSIDVFYNSLGIHAFAAVFLAFIRYFWTKAITPQGGYEGNVSLIIANTGLQWFTSFAFPLIFAHHFILFFIEAGGFLHFGYTLLKVILSSLFTFLVIILIQMLFFSRKKGL